MKIIKTEVTFTLTLPRELDTEEVSDLSNFTGYAVELMSCTAVCGEDDMDGDAFMHTFGLTADAAESSCPVDLLTHAQLSAITFVNDLPE